ncbi:MAG: 2-phosphosulfolactate phosphatase [Kosmotogaceae bacterium]|nr:2-phosphosulfolactate phosphatase [Kosmotogaceae bacterium]
MLLKVNLLPRTIDESTDLAVVVDVLRASSTITTALQLGAKKVIPVSNVERAMKERSRSPEVVLMGERETMKIPGFDLGNSPVELSEAFVKGKEVVMTTTNGTVAALRSRRAKRVIVASFLNLESIARLIEREKGRVEIQCSGSDGEPSLEDTLLAGALVARLGIVGMNDSCWIAASLYGSVSSNLRDFIAENGVHAKKLLSLGFGEDVSFCAKINLYDLVPLWRNNGFVRG